MIPLALLALIAVATAHAEDAAPALRAADCRVSPLGGSTAFRAEYRPGVEDPVSIGRLAVVGATLAYQCPGRTDAGAVIPEGWRVVLATDCGAEACPVAPAILVRDFRGTGFTGTIRDGTTIRDVRLAESRTGRIVLVVRSRAEGDRATLTARYVLAPVDAPAAAGVAKPSTVPRPS